MCYTETNVEEMDENEVDALEETNGKILEMKESVTNNVLAMADDVVDEETQDVIIDTLGDMTTGGDQFNDNTKGKIVTSLTAIVQTQVGSVAADAGRKRRSNDGHDIGCGGDGKVYSADDVSPSDVFLQFREATCS